MRISDWSSDVCSSDLANGGCLLDLRGVHHTPAPHQRPVRSKLATDLQPGRLLLKAGASDRKSTEGKAFLLGQPLQCRDRLLAVGAVEVDQRTLLAAEVSAFLILYVLNHGVGPGPVGGRPREDVWEATTVRDIERKRVG